MPKQKIEVPQVKPYKKPISEQPIDNDTQKESDHKMTSDGEQQLNGKEINICCVCDGKLKEEQMTKRQRRQFIVRVYPKIRFIVKGWFI